MEGTPPCRQSTTVSAGPPPLGIGQAERLFSARWSSTGLAEPWRGPRRPIAARRSRLGLDGQCLVANPIGPLVTISA